MGSKDPVPGLEEICQLEILVTLRELFDRWRGELGKPTASIITGKLFVVERRHCEVYNLIDIGNGHKREEEIAYSYKANCCVAKKKDESMVEKFAKMSIKAVSR